MSRGGLTIGSGRPPGRPKGSRDKKPRARPKKAPQAVVSRAFLDAASDYAASGEGFLRLKQLAESPDERLAFAAIVKLLEWGVGTPSSRPTPLPLDLRAAVAAAAAAAREELPERPEPPPVALPLISAGAPGGEQGEQGALPSSSPVAAPEPPAVVAAMAQWRRDHGR